MPSLFGDLLASLGRPAIATVNNLGAAFLFFLEGLLMGLSSPRQFRRTVHQVYIIGVKSVFVVALIGLFTGMVLGLQGYHALTKVGSEGLLGAMVALSLIRELGPVLTAIMLAGRAGSSMAAEIGVMRISDQIDALEVMDISPMAYLVGPRLWASFISFPLLTAMFDVIGIFGGYLTGVELLGVNKGVYFHRVNTSIDLSDVMSGFHKSLLFAALVTTVCCYQGFFTHLRRDTAGPESVGAATTSSVVLSCVCILVFDYVATSFLL